MAAVVTEEGERIMCKIVLNKIVNTKYLLALYTNNYTPVDKSVLADFTEVVGGGYAGNYGLSATTGWSVLTSGGSTQMTHSRVTWTFTGALGNVYGYYAKDQTGTTCVWAEIFGDGPYNVQNNGDQIGVRPRLQLD